MKTYILIVVLICIASFFAGMAKAQYDRAHYFDKYPSPLACHVDNMCDLGDLQK